jgi:hypothetical protein
LSAINVISLLIDDFPGDASLTPDRVYRDDGALDRHHVEQRGNGDNFIGFLVHPETRQGSMASAAPIPYPSNCLDSALHRAGRLRVALPSTSRITKSVALEAVNHATSASAITF